MTNKELLEIIERAAKDSSTIIDISNNQLSDLPAEIGKLVRLQALDISNNITKPYFSIYPLALCLC